MSKPSTTQSDLQTMASRLSEPMVDGLDALASRFLPQRANTLDALQKRGLVDRADLTDAGWRVWAYLKAQSFEPLSMDVASATLPAQCENNRHGQLLYLTAARMRRWSYGGHGRAQRAEDMALSLEARADALMAPASSTSDLESVQVEAFPAPSPVQVTDQTPDQVSPEHARASLDDLLAPHVSRRNRHLATDAQLMTWARAYLPADVVTSSPNPYTHTLCPTLYLETSAMNATPPQYGPTRDDMPIEARAILEARKMGREAGHAAGTWAADGNTSDDHLRRMVEMFDDGDPAVWDYLPPAPDLSEQCADDPTPQSLTADLLGEVDDLPDHLLEDGYVRADVVETIEDAWLEAASEAHALECERTIRAFLPDPEPDLEPCVCGGTGNHDGQTIDACDECAPMCPDCGRPISLQPSGWWSHDGMPNGCWRLSMDGPDDQVMDD